MPVDQLVGLGVLAGIFLVSLVRDWTIPQLVFSTATLVAALQLAGS